MFDLLQSLSEIELSLAMTRLMLVEKQSGCSMVGLPVCTGGRTLLARYDLATPT